MITSKQRATLRGMANSIPAIVQIGKGGITDTVIAQMDEALLARELVKVTVLETSPVFAREAAQELAEATKSDIVQVIGLKFTLYRPKPKDPVIKI